MATPETGERDATDAGKIRISFEYDKCGPTTIVAQQCYGLQHEYTFCPWEPTTGKNNKMSKIDDSEEDEDEEATCQIFCYLCVLINKSFKLIFDEGIDHAQDGI